MSVTDSYKKVFSDVKGFPRNITIDLVSRYAAAFGMMAAGKGIEKVFIEKKEDKNYDFQLFPLADNTVEYSKLEIPNNTKVKSIYINLDIKNITVCSCRMQRRSGISPEYSRTDAARSGPTSFSRGGASMPAWVLISA